MNIGSTTIGQVHVPPLRQNSPRAETLQKIRIERNGSPIDSTSVPGISENRTHFTLTTFPLEICDFTGTVSIFKFDQSVKDWDLSIPEIARIHTKVVKEMPPKDDAKTPHAFLFMVSSLIADDPIGVILGDLNMDNKIMLESLFIDKAYRNRNLGHFLLSFSIQTILKSRFNAGHEPDIFRATFRYQASRGGRPEQMYSKFISSLKDKIGDESRFDVETTHGYPMPGICSYESIASWGNRSDFESFLNFLSEHTFGYEICYGA